tara:strand:+ start:15795 stop:16550 length:756 start_codon:yes stop_codon:yes gene_type:complete
MPTSSSDTQPAETPYIHLHERKRTWTPVAVKADALLKGGEEVIQRALALRCLEIPVGDFINDAMKGDLPDVKGCKELLISNVKDEDKHDIALNFAAKAHKVPQKFEHQASLIKDAWLEIDRHPVLKAVILERSVFFVLLPIFRFLGDTGLRTISADISRDEQTHVCANTLVCEALGLKSDKTLNNLRRATVSWVLDPLQGKASNKHLSSNFWLKSSDNLYLNGKAEGLAETRASRMPAFFETNNVNLPQYA